MPRKTSSNLLRWRCAAAAGLTGVLAILAGCSTTPPDVALLTSADPPTVHLVSEDHHISVVRQGRYTLVELVPEMAQRDLLQQVIDITFPLAENATVGDGLHHLLRYSGYRLCTGDAGAQALYGQPLPAAHLHLGPLTLRDALLTLAGPAWDLSVDDVPRQVCFARHAEPAQVPAAVSGAQASEPAGSAAVTFPLQEIRP